MSNVELKLLDCPFCGKQPITFGSGENQKGLMIECATPNCINPHVSYYDHKSAIHAWNRRASPSIPPAGEDPAIRDFQTTETAESNSVVKDYLTTEFDNQEVVGWRCRYICHVEGPSIWRPCSKEEAEAYRSWHADSYEVEDLCRCAPKAAMSDEIKNIRSVKVQGDFAVLVEFMSCRYASEFARAIRGEING